MIEFKNILKEIKIFYKDITMADIYQYLDLLNLELKSRDMLSLSFDNPEFRIYTPYKNMHHLILFFIQSKLYIEDPDKEYYFHKKFIDEVLQLKRLIQLDQCFSDQGEPIFIITDLLEVIPYFDHILLLWNPPHLSFNDLKLPTLKSYSIFRDNILIAETNDIHLEDYNVENNTEYSYHIKTNYTNPEGVSSASGSLEVSLLDLVLNNASDFTSEQTPGMIHLSWSKPASVSYPVYVKPPQLIDYSIFKDDKLLLNTSDLELFDSDVINDTAYIYTIIANYDLGVSAPSLPLSVHYLILDSGEENGEDQDPDGGSQ